MFAHAGRGGADSHVVNNPPPPRVPGPWAAGRGSGRTEVSAPIRGLVKLPASSGRAGARVQGAEQGSGWEREGSHQALHGVSSRREGGGVLFVCERWPATGPAQGATVLGLAHWGAVGCLFCGRGSAGRSDARTARWGPELSFCSAARPPHPGVLGDGHP